MIWTCLIKLFNSITSHFLLTKNIKFSHSGLVGTWFCKSQKSWLARLWSWGQGDWSTPSFGSHMLAWAVLFKNDCEWHCDLHSIFNLIFFRVLYSSPIIMTRTTCKQFLTVVMFNHLRKWKKMRPTKKLIMNRMTNPMTSITWPAPITLSKKRCTSHPAF